MVRNTMAAFEEHSWSAGNPGEAAGAFVDFRYLPFCREKFRLVNDRAGADRQGPAVESANLPDGGRPFRPALDIAHDRPDAVGGSLNVDFDAEMQPAQAPMVHSSDMRAARIIGTTALVLIAAEVGFSARVYYAMRQTPDAFGRFMAKLPMPAMMAFPFETLWMRARAGTVHAGDVAPDFRLPTVDHKSAVQLSSFRGDRPVVLVFGSYT